MKSMRWLGNALAGAVLLTLGCHPEVSPLDSDAAPGGGQEIDAKLKGGFQNGPGGGGKKGPGGPGGGKGAAPGGGGKGGPGGGKGGGKGKGPPGGAPLAAATPGSNRYIMEKIGKGPEALATKLGEALKAEAPGWTPVHMDAKEFATLAAGLGKNEPTKGSKDSWTKLTGDFAKLAAELEKTSASKDKAAAAAAHAALAKACNSCHKEHRPATPAMKPTYPGAPPGKSGAPNMGRELSFRKSSPRLAAGQDETDGGEPTIRNISRESRARFGSGARRWRGAAASQGVSVTRMTDVDGADGSGSSFLSPSFRADAKSRPTYEAKLILPEALAREVERRLAPQLILDPHADPARDNSYHIASVYFDTPQFDVYRRAPGYREHKYRLRRYDAGDLAFCERKSKRRGAVRKRRTSVPLAELGLLENGFSPEWAGSWFAAKVRQKGLAPVYQVSYRRTAYLGCNAEGPLRLTFDRALHGLPAAAARFDGESRGTALLPENVIVEFKFQGGMAPAFKETIAALGLTFGPASKYRRCVDAFRGASEFSESACA